MNSSFLFGLIGCCTFAVLNGCGGGGGSKEDMASKIVDMSSSTVDMATVSNCTQVGTWPTHTVGALFTPNYQGSTLNDFVIEAEDPAPSTQHPVFNYLGIEVDIPSSANQKFPVTVKFDATTSFSNGGQVGANGTSIAYIVVNADLTQPRNPNSEFYLAQDGTITLTRLDDSSSGGVSVSASNLHLVQFDNTGGLPTTRTSNGKCYDVASAMLSAQYQQANDGGTDM